MRRGPLAARAENAGGQKTCQKVWALTTRRMLKHKHALAKKLFNALSNDMGRNGFEVHNPQNRYRLKNLEGEFSGLALVSWLYVGMQSLSSGADIGFDLFKGIQDGQGDASRTSLTV